MISTYSLSKARSLAPAAFRRWVLGGISAGVIGYTVMTVLEIRESGAFTALSGRNAVMALVCAIAFVIAARVDETVGCVITILATWIEVETAFLPLIRFPEAGQLILPVLVLGAGLLLGTRVAFFFALLTIATTITVSLMSPAVHWQPDNEVIYWFALHAIAVLSAWLLMALSLSAFTRVFDAMEGNERDLADTIRFAPDGILVATHEGSVLRANPAAERLLQRSNADIVGRPVADLLASASGKPVSLDSMRREDDSPLSLSHTTADGTTLHIEVTWRAMERDRDQFLLRDVSQRVREEARRRDMELQLSHAQRMDAVGRLAGGLSHDFNNILTAVSGSAELLRIEQAPAERTELLDEIIAARDRGAALTRQLLAFARREVTQPRVVDLGLHVRSLERLLQRVMGDRNRLQFALADDCRVRVDPGQLEQALVNLVANARDAMPDGGHCGVTVERARHADDSARVLLHVTDDGVGMTEELAARAFEPFFTTKSRGQGTGLGLASVHGMAESSNGSARIASTPGQGTRVTIDLPWIDEPASLPLHAVVSPMAHTGPLSILVAEDDSGTRRVVERILRHAGYVVQAVADGFEAMAMIEDTSLAFDLVLSDVMMPGHTGPEIADRMHAIRPDTPVLLMTGYAEEQLSDLLEGPTGREIITKPFAADALTGRIAKLLQDVAVAGAVRR